MKLYLVRHGETAHNRDGLGLGRADVPLTDRGERQAAALGRALEGPPIARMFSSPLARAARTAAAIAQGRPLAVEPRDELLELDVGDTEGMTFAAMREQHGQFLRRWSGPAGVDACMPGGESIRDVASRLAPLAAELRGLEVEAAAVVSHNFVTRILLCQLLDLELEAFRAFSIGLASYCLIDVQKERVTVVTMNEGCHLEALESAVHPA